MLQFKGQVVTDVKWDNQNVEVVRFDGQDIWNRSTIAIWGGVENLGKKARGTIRTQSISIRNLGSQVTGAITVSSSNSRFTISATTSNFTMGPITLSSLGVGAMTRNFNIRTLANMPVGEHSSNITISSANNGSMTFVARIVVEPIPANLSFQNAAAIQSFALVQGAAVPMARTVTITNTGDFPTGRIDIVRNNEYFTINNSASTAIDDLLPGRSATISVAPVAGLTANAFTARNYETIISFRREGIPAQTIRASVSVTPSGAHWRRVNNGNLVQGRPTQIAASVWRMEGGWHGDVGNMCGFVESYSFILETITPNLNQATQSNLAGAWFWWWGSNHIYGYFSYDCSGFTEAILDEIWQFF